jgi:hypothetical protein
VKIRYLSFLLEGRDNIICTGCVLVLGSIIVSCDVGVCLIVMRDCFGYIHDERLLDLNSFNFRFKFY